MENNLQRTNQLREGKINKKKIGLKDLSTHTAPKTYGKIRPSTTQIRPIMRILYIKVPAYFVN